MMPKPKQSKSNHNFKNEVNRMSSERVLYESQPNVILYSDNFIFKIIVLFILVFMFSPILALVYRIQGTLQSNYQLQFINMTYIAEIILFLCIIVIIVKLVLDYLDWKNTLYTLTDKRIIIKRGLFEKEKISMPYAKVQDIDVSQSVLERMLGAGDIVIYGGRDNVETILDEVPNPREVEEIILNQVNQSNYAYTQSQIPAGYNNFENYAYNPNMENGYHVSRNNRRYDERNNSRNRQSYGGHVPKDNAHDRYVRTVNEDYERGTNEYEDYTRGTDEDFNTYDDREYFEEHEDNSRNDVYDSKDNSNVHYFNTEDNQGSSFINKQDNDKKIDKSNKKLNKDDLLSINKRKFKKS
ncbi:PH domain-containing protein [Methanosphaera sp. BMS]|uniref:PH domain-containing protein n=1 Tax=Methanosphaera sp. BMS TaxID=1789762 RepID=UPI000DC1F516|nr:PH domain-containing protein [Methanosphaera sp. BMS]AWX33202.1 hypothetical protein AW729_08935 [Methanosphaera sp. BMS]